MAWRYAYLPEEEHKTPQYMYDMVEHYLNNDSTTLNVKAFRGSGKSINTVILALYLVATGQEDYVMIVSSTSYQSEMLIADIASLIDEGSVPGVRVVRSITGEIELSVGGRSSYIIGKGAGSKLRGLKKGRKRVGLAITDDLAFFSNNTPTREI